MDPITSTQAQLLDPYLPARPPPTPDVDREKAAKCFYHHLRSPHGDATRKFRRPFVTLTYAQSLDGGIAIARGARTKLSGHESMSMTHYLRKHHDAVFVGSGTARIDDPGLNCRYSDFDTPNGPRPVVYDPHDHFKAPASKMVRLYQAGVGSQPLILCAPSPDKPAYDPNSSCQYVPLEVVPSDSHRINEGHPDRFAWSCALEALCDSGLGSVMIEGGAMILEQFLLMPELVDSIIITIAPTFMGKGAVRVSPIAQQDHENAPVNAASIVETTYIPFGQDVVLCGRLGRS